MNFLPALEQLQNVHPLFVHFPVALILVTLLFEGLWWITKRSEFRSFATYLLYLSALSAVAAVFTGYIASDSLSHDSPGHEIVHEHRNVMLWMSGALLITALSVIRLRSLREGKARCLLIVALFAISGLLVYGADKGGRLVFEFGMGVKATSAKAEHGNETEGYEDDNAKEHQHVISAPDTILDSHSTGRAHTH